jgi:hypothetical protein
MSTRTKWLLALALAVSVVAVARAALQNNYYFPLVARQPQPTRTPTSTGTVTVTPTVTRTPTPTRTITPTRTQTPEPKVNIVEIQFEPEDPGEGPLDEYVRIRNDSDDSVNMDGWFLRDDSGNRYTFDDFTLGEDDDVRVWSKAGNDDSDDLFWGFVPDTDQEERNGVWNDGGDCAYLRDPDEDEPVDSICYNQDGVLYEPVMP